MNFISVFYISVFLRTTFAIFSFGNVSAPFPLTQTPPTQPAVQEDPFYSEVTQHSPSTASTSLPTTTTTSSTSTDPSTTANVTVRPKIMTTITKEKRRMIRENRRRCNKLPTFRLISTCRAIVEESLQDTDFLYVATDNADREGLRGYLLGGAESGPRTTITKGDLNCNQLTCPTKEKWLAESLPQGRSTSPWTFCHNYDPHRIPAIISVAKCLCTGCMDRNTEGENMNYVSQEVKRHMRVLRKDPRLIDFALCTDSSKLCWHATESVAVGCHCMMPIIKA